MKRAAYWLWSWWNTVWLEWREPELMAEIRRRVGEKP